MLRSGKRIGLLLHQYRYLLAVFLIGFVVWTVVFNIAVIDYVNTSSWNSRTVWLGPIGSPGHVEIFGFSIYYQFEGYSDYSFYYVHWGYNLLNGVMPYSDAFGYLDMNGIINENGHYMFPPFTAYLYGAGILLSNLMGIQNWGIGIFIAAFGFLTAIPTYGIARDLSGNPRVGEIAALTYLLNPMVIYYIDYLWLNPSPFYFFFFTGFYALIKERRHTGTLLIVAAALFKQTAWFLGIPLVVYLLMKKRAPNEAEDGVNALESADESEEPQAEKSTWQEFKEVFDPLLAYIDLRAFIVSVIVVLLFVGAVILPFLVAQPWFFDFWRISFGARVYENYTELPSYGVPMRLSGIWIANGDPGIAAIVDSLIVSGAPLVFSVVLVTGMMFMTPKMEGNEAGYMRRLLYSTLLIMLLVTLFGPRGVYKYYASMFGPFFSIVSSARMTQLEGGRVPVSTSMIWAPILCSLAIFIPDRNYYLGLVAVIFVIYLLSPVLNKPYVATKGPFTKLKETVSDLTGLRYEPFAPVMQAAPGKARFLQMFQRVIAVFLGLVLVWYGLISGLSAVGGTTIEVLRALILSAILLFLGPQVALSPMEAILPDGKKEPAVRSSLRISSGSVSALALCFGVLTYLLSWDIEVFLTRQLMVFSGTFLIIWALSVIVGLRNRVRVTADMVLLLGCALGIIGWWLAGDAVLAIIGLTLGGLIVLHLMSVTVSIWSGQENEIPTPLDETGIQVSS